MPQLVAFNRRWNVGSDDFVFSGAADFIIRSVWFVVIVAVYSHYRQELDDDCDSGHLLHAYFIGLTVFLAITAIIAFLMAYISMQGTIADSASRRRFPILLYIRLAVAIPEVTWNAVGTCWAFSSDPQCHRNIVNIAKGTVIAGWVLVLIAILTILVLFNAFGGKKTAKRSVSVRSYRRGSRRTLSSTKTWEKRCKCMFWCASGGERSTSVFSTLAQLSADYFKGVDLTPTDVLAGLILLSQKQERKRQQLQIVVSDSPKRPISDDVTDGAEVINVHEGIQDDGPSAWMTLDNMSHFLKFAIGSYGWPFYITLINPVLGLCALCSECRCCACKDDQGSIYMDNCCMCNSAAFKKSTGIPHEDIVYASFQNEICEIPFYVVVDRETNSVVVAVRGTLSLQDVITDLVIERGEMYIPGCLNACAHKGILESAFYIRDVLNAKNILDTAFEKIENAKLVITGHSLGAGVAGLLAILLKPTYPKLQCFAYSPPGELVSPDVAMYARDIVCSVVLGDDIITRQGMLMMDDLKLQILNAVFETRIPKYKILARGCWRMCCGRAATLDEVFVGDQVDGNVEKSRKTLDTKTVETRNSLEISMRDCMHHSLNIKNSYQVLQLPGKIIHIEQSNLSGDEEFTATWKGPNSFSEIIVSPDMLSHHFPDALLEAIDDLREKQTSGQPSTVNT